MSFTIETGTDFAFLNEFTIDSDKFPKLPLRSVGVRKKLVFSIYGVAYYDDNTEFDTITRSTLVGSSSNKLFILKMYRNLSVDRVLDGLLKSLQTRFKDPDSSNIFLTALKVESKSGMWQMQLAAKTKSIRPCSFAICSDRSSFQNSLYVL